MRSGPGYSLSCALGWVIDDRAIVLDDILVRESRAQDIALGLKDVLD